MCMCILDPLAPILTLKLMKQVCQRSVKPDFEEVFQDEALVGAAPPSVRSAFSKALLGAVSTLINACVSQSCSRVHAFQRGP